MMRDVEEDVLLRWWRRAWRSNPPGPAPAMITRRVSMDVFGRHMFFLLLYCVPSWFICSKGGAGPGGTWSHLGADKQMSHLSALSSLHSLRFFA